MKCNSCGADLPDSPERAVEENNLDEVIGHKHQPDDDAPKFVMSRKEFYCSPECLYQKLNRDRL